MAALRRKKASEQDLDRLAEIRLHLEVQVDFLESATSGPYDTFLALKEGAAALERIHGSM